MVKRRMATYSIIFENLANILIQHVPDTDPAAIIEGTHVAQPFWEPSEEDNIHFCDRTLLRPVNILMNGAVYYTFPVGSPVKLTLRNDGIRKAILTVPEQNNSNLNRLKEIRNAAAAAVPPPPRFAPVLRRQFGHIIGGRRTRTRGTRRNRTRGTRRNRTRRTRRNRTRRN
jgi:hypothetical protein